LAQLSVPQFFAQNAGHPISPRAVFRHAAQAWEAISAGSSRAGAGPVPPAPIQTSPWEASPAPTPSVPAPVTSPPTSVIGTDVLSSISQAVGELSQPPIAKPAVTSSTSPTATSGEDSRAAFQRLRERIEQMEKQGHQDLSASASAIASAMSPVAPAEPASFLNPPPVAAGPPPSQETSAIRLPVQASTLDELYAQLRLVNTSGPHEFLPDLAAALRFAGQHFPIAHTCEFSVPNAAGSAVQWLTPDGEILVGLEPPTARSFWEALCAEIRAREPEGRRKVIAFLAAEMDLIAHPASSLNTMPEPPALEMALIEASTRSKLAAFHVLLQRHEAGKLPYSAEELSGLLASQLAGFWKRFTRLRSPSES
jgi:hypothetical protein